jgi:hypothetical protein
MISHTTLAAIMKRNRQTPNLQANVFIQEAFPPTHVKPHVALPATIDTHGQAISPFLMNGN